MKDPAFGGVLYMPVTWVILKPSDPKFLEAGFKTLGATDLVTPASLEELVPLEPVARLGYDALMRCRVG
jgi:hypothetical protein